MLIPFVIDVDSLAPDPKWSPPTERACYNSLLALGEIEWVKRLPAGL
jgi:hypothetical protein